MRDEAVTSLRALNEVVERLRAPGGCPWDREQTHRSLRPYLLEETYELLEAIESGDPVTLREELGDVLLQVLMHAAIAAEQPDGFDLGDIADTTRTKMVHRHPHVFGTQEVDGAESVVVNWERLKRSEKQGRLSLLDGIPRALPALAYAQGIQKRPARLGFDQTPSTASAMDQLTATVAALQGTASGRPEAARGADWTVSEGEIRSAGPAAVPPHEPPPPPAALELEDAVADVLFAVVAVARRLRVNPEDALRRRTAAFAERFRSVEDAVRDEGGDLHAIDETEWARRWQRSAPPAR